MVEFRFQSKLSNTDGYIFSWTTNRWWRKNLRKTKNSCMGVDLNRNFDVNFGNPTNSYCFEDWKGFKPFSEKESQAERDYLNELNAKGNKLDLFIAFHSYGQQVRMDCQVFNVATHSVQRL